MSLRRYTWRAMQQRPGRTILTMLSIVIGVTAAVAVGLGTATTRNAYKQMFALVTGRATLVVEAAGGGAFEENVFETILAVTGVTAATPLIERPTSMSLEGGQRRVRLQILGIDPRRDSSVRDYTIAAGRQVAEGDELVLEEGFAKYLGLKIGDEVKLLTRRLSKPFVIVGLLRSQAAAAVAQTAMAFLPIEPLNIISMLAARRITLTRFKLLRPPTSIQTPFCHTSVPFFRPALKFIGQPQARSSCARHFCQASRD